MTKEEFSTKHDLFYQKANEFLKRVNPCKIKCGTCLRGRELKVESFCCNGCKNLGENGCTVEALWCKMWTCSSVKFTEETKKEWKLILQEIIDSKIPLFYRSSKEQALKVLNL